MNDMNDISKLRTWIELDTKAIAYNVAAFRSYIKPSVKLLGVIKSNAYGHGLIDFAKPLIKNNVDWLGVDSYVEGARLRKEGITQPILVLGYTVPELIAEAAENNISIGVSHSSTFDAIEKLQFSKKIKIHLKVDTGMYRQGFILKDAEPVLARIKALADKVEFEGLFTHFSSAKNPAFPAYTQKQIAEFEQWRALVKAAGFLPIVHASATSGTLLFPEAHYDMVRIGIGLYGLWPSHEVEQALVGKISLKPVLTWKTIISEIKSAPKDARVGYDGTEVLRRDSVIGICPIGYWHGFPRSLSSVGEVLVNGKPARVLGRVSMDMIIIDLTDCGEVAIRDEVVIIGEQKGSYASAEHLAYLGDVSWYELTTRINPLIRKIER